MPRLLRRHHVVAVAVAVLLTASIGAQNPDLRPGKYSVTIQVSIGGEPDTPEDEGHCFTAANVTQFDRWVVSKMGESCVISDRKIGGGRTVFTLTCKKENETWRSELTGTAESFVLRMSRDETIDGLKVATQITATGKRTGDCDQ